MAYRAFCDNKKCEKPIAPEDNHFEVSQFGIVDKAQVFRAQNLHFCGKSCLCQWVDSALDRPMILVPPHAKN